MKFEFDTNVDFNGTYNLSEQGKLKVEVKDGRVSLEYLPVYTTGYLRVADEDLFPGATCTTEGNTSISTSNAYTYNWDEEEGDEFEINIEEDESGEEDENVEENEKEDEFYELAQKVSEYDKSGWITSILTELVEYKTPLSDKVATNISKIMCNLSETLALAKEKMQENCANG